jgi:hypothetical protein
MEFGASLAARFAREISAGERNLNKTLHHIPLRSVHAHPLFERYPVGDFCLETGSYGVLASQIASKSYFSGEIAGLRLSRRTGGSLAGSFFSRSTKDYRPE